MSSLWIGIAGLALGAGTAVYGANKQAKAVKEANATNVASTQDQNASAWVNYLMTRGISPTKPVAAGQMPTAGNFVATNTKLPLWAGYTTTPGVNGAPSTYALATPAMGGFSGGPTDEELAEMNAADATAKKPSRLVEALDPLGIMGGSKPSVKKFLDPLGFF